LPEGSRNIMLLLVILIGGLFALAVLIKDPRKKKTIFRVYFMAVKKIELTRRTIEKNRGVPCGIPRIYLHQPLLEN